jgi:hypothetical protein
LVKIRSVSCRGKNVQTFLGRTRTPFGSASKVDHRAPIRGENAWAGTYRLWGRTAVLTIILDPKVLVYATRIMACSKDEASECLEATLPVADHRRNRRRRKQSTLANPDPARRAFT